MVLLKGSADASPFNKTTDIKYMCWYTDFLFVISIKFDFKYLLSTYYSLKSGIRKTTRVWHIKGAIRSHSLKYKQTGQETEH
jgi:hypothetical protein